MDDGSNILSISGFLPEIYISSLLLFLSAFFSLSETALFSITREIKKEMSNNDTFINKAITSLLKHPEKLLITLLLGNMSVNVAFFCTSYGITKDILAVGNKNSSLWAGITSGSSLLAIIIFGEVIPKTIALRIPVRISKAVAIPVIFLKKLFILFIVPLNFVTEKISILFTKNDKNYKNMTVDELKMIVDIGEKQGLVDETEHFMINAVLDFQKKLVKEVMIPRVDMVTCSVTETTESFLDIIRKTKLTKIPVYSNIPDAIIGVVHAKDVFLNTDKALREFVRPIEFIPETKTIESLLREFRSKHQQIAIAIDEYGGTSGLISLEDILEEIVGEINDEHDPLEEDDIRKVNDTTYYLSGNLSIRDWCNYFEVELETQDFDTIGGLVISLLGSIPAKGDVVEYENMKFTVEKLRKRRIVTLIMEFVL